MTNRRACVSHPMVFRFVSDAYPILVVYFSGNEIRVYLYEMGIQDLIITPIYIVIFTLIAYFIRPYVTNKKTRKTALFFVFLDCWIMFTVVSIKFPSVTKWLTISILFILSPIFWNSGILKAFYVDLDNSIGPECNIEFIGLRSGYMFHKEIGGVIFKECLEVLFIEKTIS